MRWDKYHTVVSAVYVLACLVASSVLIIVVFSLVLLLSILLLSSLGWDVSLANFDSSFIDFAKPFPGIS